MLAPHLNVKENLAYAQIHTTPSFFKFLPSVELPELLQTFAISENTPVGKLSGGQRQIIAITMALQKDTKLLLLDEPTATLDPENSALVMKFLTKLITKQNITIVIICHDPSLYHYSDQEVLSL